ncbi:divergent polysaccharide deacetylase family protein [Maricaulis parjimensis]|uniref:divergent polysaccharide deacetylase family protein n=1 Tax=Maricaulis parjimensis TaxID=144023 RepID=UPI001939DBE4|nr:divergent polysaccharide deacetylase family protein [Maricaulis parjimensis]
MPTAVLRHAQPLLTVRAPLIAGIATAGLLALAIGGIALFGEPNTQLPTASGRFDPAPVITAEAGHGETAGHETAGAPIRFLEPEAEEEITLDGVHDGFEAPAPAQGSDPADAEARHAATTPPVPAANPNALARAPMAGLTEPGPGGPLPRIAPDGTRPSRAYARPFHGDPGAPTIAVVIGGMGLNAAVTQAAIDELPPEVALSFAPYTRDLQDWINRARAAGHEVLIEAPMEPFDYPNNDPGPHTLLADGSAEENARRLAWVLSRATGYFGVTNYLGARFSASPGALGDVFGQLEQRGVAFLHDGAGRRSTIEGAARSADLEYAIADRILDEDLSPDAIDERLLALEALALQNGAALGSGFAYPATVDQVRDWTAGLDLRGYQLAPPSAVMARRRLEARLAEEARAHEPRQAEPNRAPVRTNVGPQHGAGSADDDHAAPASSGH